MLNLLFNIIISYNILKKYELLYFEQDGESALTSHINMVFIEKLFGKNALIRNPPNSSDLAFPIEYIWVYIKPRKKVEIRDIKRIKKIYFRRMEPNTKKQK